MAARFRIFQGQWRLARLALMLTTLLCLGWGGWGNAAQDRPSATTNPVPGRPGAGGTGGAPVAVPAFRQANNVAVLRVEGVIDTVTLTSLERRIKRAVKDGADAIVLDLDTPGGEVFSTLEICSLLKDANETPVNTVAWIHVNAYSAGTIMALACREIVVAPNSTFGDAAPIKVNLMGEIVTLSPEERAKADSPIIAEIIDSARRNGYDEKLVQAFVRLTGGLWMLENVQTGQRIVVDLAEYQNAFGERPPAIVNPAIIPGAAPPKQVLPSSSDVAAKAAAPPKLGDEIYQSRPPARQPLTPADRGQWRLVRHILDDSTLLTLKPAEAIHYGLAAAVISSDAELKAFFGAQQINRYDQTWSESLVRFLISLPVRFILIIIFLISFFIELASPGMGIFGATAVAALLLAVGAPALAGMAQWWDILLVVVGMLLVCAELFILPGIGVAGVAGVLCLLVGLVGTFVTEDITTVGGQDEMWSGLLTTLTAMFVAGVTLWLISRHIYSLPFLNQIILKAELASDSSPAAGAAASPRGLAGGGNIGLLEAMGAAQRALAPGDLGVAETDLRPSGRANFNGRLVDVQSSGGYIDRGATIRVSSVGRFVIEVEEQSS